MTAPPPENPRSRPASAQVIFAGGGTGGHLYPGLAIAEQLQALDSPIDIAFLCSDKLIDAEILTKAAVPFHALPARPLLLRPIPMGIVRFVKGWFNSIRAAGVYLDNAIRVHGSADAITVVLMGGYVAAPVAKAAAQRGIRILMVNLDVVPGKANQLAARWTDEIISAIHCTAPPRFAQADVIGMPIRTQALASGSPEECRTRLGLHPDRNTLLIMGASQGAESFNDLLAAMVANPEFLPAFTNWQILHLAGTSGVEKLQEAYESAGLKAVVLPFCHEMGTAYGSANLALSRAGASSVAEVAINLLPTIFAPYPFHHDEHQKANAQPLVDRGGSWLVRDTNSVQENLTTIGRTLSALLTDSPRRAAAVAALKQSAPTNAAATIAALLCKRAATAFSNHST